MRIGYRATCVWCDGVIEDSTWLVDRQDGHWHNECADEVLRTACQRRPGPVPAAPSGLKPEYSLAAPSRQADEMRASAIQPAAVTASAPPLKRCTKCGKEYPATPEFFHRSNGKLKPYCKQCANKYWQEYYERKGKSESPVPGSSANSVAVKPAVLRSAPLPADPRPLSPEPIEPLAPDAALTPAECRRRREALRLTPEMLAQRASVGGAALEGFEAGTILLSEDALRRIRKALAPEGSVRPPVPLGSDPYAVRSNGAVAAR